jgi:hypothetical protein
MSISVIDATNEVGLSEVKVGFSIDGNPDDEHFGGTDSNGLFRVGSFISGTLVDISLNKDGYDNETTSVLMDNADIVRTIAMNPQVL